MTLKSFRPRDLVFIALIGVAVLVAGGLGYLVWPTPWRYDQVKMEAGTFPIRIHRMTDRTEILLGPSGWVHASDEDSAPSDKPLASLSIEEITKIQGTLAVTNYGWLDLSLHNGTNKQLRELLVELVIDAQGGQEMTKREYQLPVYKGDPLSAFTIKAECGCQLMKGQGYNWRIVGAKAE